MRKFYSLLMVLVVSVVLLSCSSDDDTAQDFTVYPFENYTKDMFIGEWEGYAEKEIVVNPMGNITINEGAVNNPWETMECYRLELNFTNTKLTETYNEWDNDQARYLCNVQVSYTDNWIYEDGDNNFTHFERHDGDILFEYISYVHFLDNGDLITWYENYHGTNVATFYKKK